MDPTPQAIAAAVEQLTTDEAFTRELLAKAREGVVRYTWDRAYRQLDDAVEAALSS